MYTHEDFCFAYIFTFTIRSFYYLMLKANMENRRFDVSVSHFLLKQKLLARLLHINIFLRK